MDDDKTTIARSKGLVRRFCEDRDWDQFHTPKDLSIGIATEASELLSLFRFKSDEECLSALQGEGFRSEVGEELADIHYFLLRFAQMYGFDLSEELDRKVRKNGLRYPVEKARESNKKYNQLV